MDFSAAITLAISIVRNLLFYRIDFFLLLLRTLTNTEWFPSSKSASARQKAKCRVNPPTGLTAQPSVPTLGWGELYLTCLRQSSEHPSAAHLAYQAALASTWGHCLASRVIKKYVPMAIFSKAAIFSYEKTLRLQAPLSDICKRGTTRALLSRGPQLGRCGATAALAEAPGCWLPAALPTPCPSSSSQMPSFS